jgi:hypothetical protein
MHIVHKWYVSTAGIIEGQTAILHGCSRCPKFKLEVIMGQPKNAIIGRKIYKNFGCIPEYVMDRMR